MIDVELVADKEVFIPHSVMTAFVQEIARLTGVSDLGLMMAPHLSIANYGCWGRYLLNAETLGAALQRGVDSIALHSRGDGMAISFDRGLAWVSYSSAAKGRAGYNHVAAGVVGVVLSVCKLYLPASWRPVRVEMDIPKPRHVAPFEEGFSCKVVFGARATSVWLEERDLQARRPRVVAQSRVTLEDVARARTELKGDGSVRHVVVEQIRTQVLSGAVTISGAARALDTSVRSLQRELNREGTDFRSLTSAVRIQRAMELLRGGDVPITSIAFELGFSAPGHFTRAFGKATGLSPRAYREAQTMDGTTRLAQYGKRWKPTDV